MTSLQCHGKNFFDNQIIHPCKKLSHILNNFKNFITFKNVAHFQVNPNQHNTLMWIDINLEQALNWCKVCITIIANDPYLADYTEAWLEPRIEGCYLLSFADVMPNLKSKDQYMAPHYGRNNSNASNPRSLTQIQKVPRGTWSLADILDTFNEKYLNQTFISKIGN